MSLTADSDKFLHRTGTVLLVVHILNSTVHGVTHEIIPVHIAAWKQGIAGLVVFFGPIAGYLLVRQGRQQLGGLLYAVSFVLAFGFSGLHHFVLQNPDFVGSVPIHRLTVVFRGTAVLEVGTECAGIVVGSLLYRDANR